MSLPRGSCWSFSTKVSYLNLSRSTRITSGGTALARTLIISRSFVHVLGRCQRLGAGHSQKLRKNDALAQRYLKASCETKSSLVSTSNFPPHGTKREFTEPSLENMGCAKPSLHKYIYAQRPTPFGMQHSSFITFLLSS
jgi:hypothetical protein